MTQGVPPKASSQAYPWTSDELFFIIYHPFRQHVLKSLANGDWKTTTELNGGSGLIRHAVLKHLTAMCEGKVLVKKKNPKDPRKPLYALSPDVLVSRTADGIKMDFGCCELPLSDSD